MHAAGLIRNCSLQCWGARLGGVGTASSSAQVVGVVCVRAWCRGVWAAPRIPACTLPRAYHPSGCSGGVCLPALPGHGWSGHHVRYAQPCLSPTRVCWMGGSVLGPLVVRPGPHALLAPVVMHMGFGAKWISGLWGGCVGSEGHDSSVTGQQPLWLRAVSGSFGVWGKTPSLCSKVWETVHPHPGRLALVDSFL